MSDLSVVVVAGSEDKGMEQMLASVAPIASEIVIIDTGIDEAFLQIAKKFEAKIFKHEPVSYVEKIRNFAIGKATSDWILIMDPDEAIGKDLRSEIKKIIHSRGVNSDTSGVSFGSPEVVYYRIPRKNIIFGKWIAHSRWWPDYNIRLFKKGFVSWNEIIHTVPVTKGKGGDFPDKEELAIVHHNYNDIDEYFSKMLRYTKAQAENLIKDGYKFKWQDLITKPTNEFLSRYFSGKGYKDGVHGLVLSLLQAFSELVLYIRIWNYKQMKTDKSEINSVLNQSTKDLKWWIRKEFSWLKFLQSS